MQIHWGVRGCAPLIHNRLHHNLSENDPLHGPKHTRRLLIRNKHKSSGAKELGVRWENREQGKENHVLVRHVELGHVV